jgi:hypothetical protein
MRPTSLLKGFSLHRCAFSRRRRMNAVFLCPMTWRLSICLATFVTMVLGCNKSANPPANQPQGGIVEPYVPDSGSVGFDLEPAKNANGSSQWLATYASQGKTAKFRIELDPAQGSDKPVGSISVKFGKGRFVAEPGSDSSVLLADLKKALEAKKLPAKVQRSNTLPFTYASMGENYSQASGGGFNASPPGNWMPIKLFLGDGDEEAEVFLNLNPIIKKGQFSIKDSDYGDALLKYFAKVL